MIQISEALEIIKRETFSLSAETLKLETAVGRVLAEEIRADMDLPPFDRSQMDGFAVRTKDVKNTPADLRIIGESIAGKGFDGEVKAGEAVRIMTGARVPAGADSVQKVELTEERDGFIKILEATKINQNTVLKGAEITSGEKIFDSGEIVSENMIAAIASFGCEKLKVYRRPKIAVLSTGTEIVEIGEMPQKDQIRNSNSVMLKVFADRYADVSIISSVKDDVESLSKAIASAIENYDILITTGGVSVGDYDFTKPVLRELGAEIFFERISLKPGKPTVFARKDKCLIFGLPGNPVSAAVTFFLFVRTAILKMQSATNAELKKGFAVVASEKIKAPKERDAVLPVSLATDEDGKLKIESLRFSGSSNFIAFARADALAFVPQNETLKSGETAQIYFL